MTAAGGGSARAGPPGVPGPTPCEAAPPARSGSQQGRGAPRVSGRSGPRGRCGGAAGRRSRELRPGPPAAPSRCVLGRGSRPPWGRRPCVAVGYRPWPSWRAEQGRPQGCGACGRLSGCTRWPYRLAPCGPATAPLPARMDLGSGESESRRWGGRSARIRRWHRVGDMTRIPPVPSPRLTFLRQAAFGDRPSSQDTGAGRGEGWQAWTEGRRPQPESQVRAGVWLGCRFEKSGSEGCGKDRWL